MDDAALALSRVSESAVRLSYSKIAEEWLKLAADIEDVSDKE